MFAVSALIGLAIVTILSLAVTNVAIIFELTSINMAEKHFIYRYLTNQTVLVVTN